MPLVEFEIGSLREHLSCERMNARMTQRDVAARIGCTREWVSRFERGHSGSTLELVAAYARLFGVGLLMDIPATGVDLLRSGEFVIAGPAGAPPA